MAAELKRAGTGGKLIIYARDANGQKSRPDASLVKRLIKAHALNNKLKCESGGASLAAIAKREGLTGWYLTRLLRLANAVAPVQLN